MSSEVENPDREVLHLHIGSGGIQVGDHCWQLYCLEHNLNTDGCLLNEQNPPRVFSLNQTLIIRKSLVLVHFLLILIQVKWID
jgi:hypothetical protein